MIHRRVLTFLFLVGLFCHSISAQTPENFRRENLVAWCIVPFDVKERTPIDRAAMLNELGIKKCAYDWRAQHVPEFEAEILEYKKRNIEYFAFWDQHETAYELFEKHRLTPQIWKMMGPVSGESQKEKVESAVESLLPLVDRTAQLGCQLGLYNHGGWGGEPANMVAVCQALRATGHSHVGIVYNFHHGHEHIADFESSLELMKPYLFCLNLNGMVDLNSPKFSSQQSKYKILPIGSGDHEKAMIETIIKSKYSGPIGVLGHVAERDVKEVLRENIEGLEWVLGARAKPDWLKRQEAPVNAKPLVAISETNQALDARLGFVNIEAADRLNNAPFSIHCRARLFSQSNFNILVAKNPKSSTNHWELYTYATTGELSFYVPGFQPAEIKSGVDVVDGNWHDLAVDFDGKTVILHVDGKAVHRQTISTRQQSNVMEGPLTIGSLASQQVGCDGEIDWVQIYDAAKSDSAARKLGEWTFDMATNTEEIKDDSTQDLPTHFVQTSQGADYLAKWTPKSRQNIRFPYENEKDPDWDDDRFSRMDTGPFLNQSIKVPGRGTIAKAIAVKARSTNQAHFMFNTETRNIEAAWVGDFVALPPARFAILQTPSVAGSVKLLGSKKPDLLIVDHQEKKTVSTDKSNSRFKATALIGDKTAFYYQVAGNEILEIPSAESRGEFVILERWFATKAEGPSIRIPLFDIPESASFSSHKSGNLDQDDIFVWKDRTSAYVLQTTNEFDADDQVRLHIEFNDAKNQTITTAAYGKVPLDQLEKAVGYLSQKKPSKIEAYETARPDNYRRRWGDPIVTQGVVSTEESPFVVDTISMPYENRFNALMFASGFDFLPDGRAFVGTVHGDVWLVSGIDDELKNISWQRFATGLYHPLGLKVVDGIAHVLCRDRITKLIDVNGDGEADVYENFNDDLVIEGQNHGYAMSLETDPAGNFYFIKSGSSPPHGGTMLKVSSDGSSLEVFATGYRHANGLGVSPTGMVTSADNEGNWIPSTRIDVVRQGGFYGHMPTHRRDLKPTTYDPPLMWLPRSMDNSAGGQVWVDSPTWGPLNGSLIHLSFGRCTANVVLPQKIEDTYQAAAFKMDLPLFLSGSMRGRFNPADGHLYVCGLDGWQTAAVRDGCFQRVRATGKPYCVPIAFEVKENEIQITFSESLDEHHATTLGNWTIEQWNYLWSQEYGSDHYSVADPSNVGHDPVALQSIELSDDGRTLTLGIDAIKAVMQMNIRATLKTEQGEPVELDLYNTINKSK